MGALKGEQGEQNLFETWTRRILFGATLLLCLLPGLANAQVVLPGLSDGASPTALAEQSHPETQEAANALVARRNEAEVRALLLDHLGTLPSGAPDASAAGLSDSIFHTTLGAFRIIVATFQGLPNRLTGQPGSFVTFYDRLGPNELLGFVGLLAVTLRAISRPICG